MIQKKRVRYQFATFLSFVLTEKRKDVCIYLLTMRADFPFADELLLTLETAGSKKRTSKECG
jgi:hypothetical protein